MREVYGWWIYGTDEIYGLCIDSQDLKLVGLELEEVIDASYVMSNLKQNAIFNNNINTIYKKEFVW